MDQNRETLEFQSRLVSERQSRGISQSRLAYAIGVTQPHMSYIEQGKRPLTNERCRMIKDFFREFDRG